MKKILGIILLSILLVCIIIGFFGIRYLKGDNIENWKDIVAVSAGATQTIGLKKDGTVVAVGWDSMS